ncbi:unnamed protein product, partial [marine sediment metagenome]
ISLNLRESRFSGQALLRRHSEAGVAGRHN